MGATTKHVCCSQQNIKLVKFDAVLLYKFRFLTHLPAWQVGLRAIWEKYYEEAHAIIYVIDAATASSFEEAKSALGMLILFSFSYKLLVYC